jgi:hypothetical protein
MLETELVVRMQWRAFVRGHATKSDPAATRTTARDMAHLRRTGLATPAFEGAAPWGIWGRCQDTPQWGADRSFDAAAWPAQTTIAKRKERVFRL